MVTVSILARFAARVVQDGECWRWTGYINKGGYGTLPNRDTSILAHRISYEYHVADIPDGLVLDHLCRNRWCVNPYHLEPVTQKVNTNRGDTGAVFREQTHCANGHEFNEQNTYHRRDSKGRECRTCQRDRTAKYRTRKAAA